MAVREVVMFEVEPGRFEDFKSIARELKTILERVDVGLTSIHFNQTLIAGTMSGSVSLVAEYDSLASWATSIERASNDPALLALVREAMGPNPAATIVNRFLATELDL